MARPLARDRMRTFELQAKRKRHLLKKMSQREQDETRTHTILRPLPPQSSVYTNFTTCASLALILARCETSFTEGATYCTTLFPQNKFCGGPIKGQNVQRTTIGCPEQDSNLHTSRHAHLKRTRLPIPPSGLSRQLRLNTMKGDLS